MGALHPIAMKMRRKAVGWRTMGLASDSKVSTIGNTNKPPQAVPAKIDAGHF
jgi:hypothetical protein